MHRGHSFAAAALLLLLSGCIARETAASRYGSLEWQTPWAEWSIRPSLARRITDTTIHVGGLPYAETDEVSEQWLRKTTTFFGGAKRVQWTDTLSCAAARTVLSDMYALEMPRPTQGGLIEVRTDGVLYALSTDGRYASGRLARVSISSSGETPLADWAERSVVVLEACWVDLPPADIRQGLQADRR